MGYRNFKRCYNFFFIIIVLFCIVGEYTKSSLCFELLHASGMADVDETRSSSTYLSCSPFSSLLFTHADYVVPEYSRRG